MKVKIAALEFQKTQDKIILEKQLKENKRALKQKEQAEKEQKKLEKQQKQLERDQKNFEKEQKKIASNEKTLIKYKNKRQDALKDLDKMQSKFAKSKDKGKLTPVEIEKENLKITKKQLKIKELEEDILTTEKKLNKLR
ncbi:hypothetical protein [Flavobacterium sp.]